jgi:hypothetical protein
MTKGSPSDSVCSWERVAKLIENKEEESTQNLKSESSGETVLKGRREKPE